MSGQFRPGEIDTPGGHRLDEVVSALQKCCRRGLLTEAAYFASELDIAGYGAWAWRRLEVIASEDVGLADEQLPATLHALRVSWEQAKKREKHRTGVGNSTLFLMHAVALIARSGKSRMLDHLVAVMYGRERPRLEVPGFAIDAHTARGRREGLGSYDDSYALTNEDRSIDDPHEDEARWLDGAPPRQTH